MIDKNYDLIINGKEEFKNKFISITGNFDFFLKIILTGEIGTNLSTIKIEPYEKRNTLSALIS